VPARSDEHVQGVQHLRLRRVALVAWLGFEDNRSPTSPGPSSLVAHDSECADDARVRPSRLPVVLASQKQHHRLERLRMIRLQCGRPVLQEKFTPTDFTEHCERGQ